MNKQKFLDSRWRRRKRRVRKKVLGEAERPRLTVFRSARHFYAQIIDDTCGVTLVSASTLGDDLGGDITYKGNCAAAAKTGEIVARKALDVGIHKVRFDRNGYKFHGRVKALADAAREAGLAF